MNKNPLLSKTIWGGLLAVGAAVAPNLLPINETMPLLDSALSLVGGALAIYGRYKAVQPVGGN